MIANYFKSLVYRSKIGTIRDRVFFYSSVKMFLMDKTGQDFITAGEFRDWQLV